MTKTTRHEHPLQRSGQTQSQRLLPALDPAFFKPDDRSAEEILAFAVEYAKELIYYDHNDEKAGDWQAFLSQVNQQSIETLEQMPNKEPHFVLFLCFLKLFGHAQRQMNKLTQKHLDYYYQSVLQIQKKSETGDSVHLVFELAKHAHDYFLKKGTRFQAGKDDTGRPVFYEASEDTVLNKAKVSRLQTVLYQGGKLHIAPIANSSDGLGEVPSEQPFAWLALGDAAHTAAPIGFAVAAPILRLTGGDRDISINLKISPLSNPAILNQASNALRIYVTGEKGWLGPFRATGTTIVQADSSVKWSLQVERVGATLKAITNYQPKIHEGDFNTNEPIMRLLFDSESAAPFMGTLEQVRVQSIQIGLKVQGDQSLELGSTQGPIDKNGTFAPFGTAAPVSGARFKITSKETFSKPLRSITVKMNWLQFPTDPNYHYRANMRVMSGRLAGQNQVISLTSGGSQTIAIPQIQFYWPMILGYELASATTTFKSHAPAQKMSVKQGNVSLKSNKFSTSAISTFLLNNAVFMPYFLMQSPHLGIQMTLDVSHKTNGFDKTFDTHFVPKLNQFSLDYEAETPEESLQTTDSSTFSNRSIQFFQVGCFGQAEVHGFIHHQGSTAPALLSMPGGAGTLFIGLEQLAARQTVNLLVQVLEGSANPLKKPEKIQWSVLGRNQWIGLDEKNILIDRTNGLLRSGLIRFEIPASASTDNTLMHSDLIWLRASVGANTDAVCKILEVKAQGIMVAYKNEGNSPHHLDAALAAQTISKAVIAENLVKKINQPHPSFGGRAAESDLAYYTRVSERLRHKQRAVSIWDYERLILEQFSEVFQVKCISHCSGESEVSPGDLTLVAIPDFRNYHAGDPLRPMLPLDTLDRIQEYATAHATAGIEVFVQNPDYEQVVLSFKVRFHQPDFGHYRNELNKDLIRLISPWSNSESGSVDFDGRFYKSALIYAIERLEYIDYILDFELRTLSIAGVLSPPLDLAQASAAKAILVPAAQHQIMPHI